MEKYFYVYILASKKNGTLYIGVTFIIGYSYGSLIRTFRDDDRLVCDCPASLVNQLGVRLRVCYNSVRITSNYSWNDKEWILYDIKISTVARVFLIWK